MTHGDFKGKDNLVYAFDTRDLTRIPSVGYQLGKVPGPKLLDTPI